MNTLLNMTIWNSKNLWLIVLLLIYLAIGWLSPRVSYGAECSSQKECDKQEEMKLKLEDLFDPSSNNYYLLKSIEASVNGPKLFSCEEKFSRPSCKRPEYHAETLKTNCANLQICRGDFNHCNQLYRQLGCAKFGY